MRRPGSAGRDFAHWAFSCTAKEGIGADERVDLK